MDECKIGPNFFDLHLALGQHILEAFSYILVIFVPDLKEKSFIVFINISESHWFVDEVESDFLKEDCEQSEEHCDDCVGHQKSVPEPDSKVDLFVDYILQTKVI